MGLGAKIKEALHGDHHDQTTSDVKAPGAYPDDDLPQQKHSDGKQYIAPHGSLIGKERDTTGSAGTHTGDRKGTDLGNTSATAPTGNLASTSGSPRNKLHKDTDDYVPIQEAYSQPTHGHHSQEDYSQPTHGHQTKDSGVGLDHHTSGKDRDSQGVPYWGDLSQQGHRGQVMTEDVPDRTYRGQDPTGGGRGDRHSLVADQAVGGGVYNTVTGAGSPDHSGSQGRSHASGGRAVHDPLTSSTKGTGIPSDNLYEQKTDRHSHGIPTSRKDHTGSGLAGAGAAAGAGTAAGYGAKEYSQRGHGNTGYKDSTNYDDRAGYNDTAGYNDGTGYNDTAGYKDGTGFNDQPGYNDNAGYKSGTRDTHVPGIPHSSLLDPEPGVPSSSTQQNRQESGFPSATQPSQGNQLSAASGTAAGGGLLGKDHYGPAHEGAKVVHTCQHCGRDNDISQYFRKEAVYRLGS